MKQIFIKPLLVFILLLFVTTAFAQFNWSSSCYSSTRTSFAEQERELKPPFELEEELPITTSGRFLIKENILYFPVSGNPNKVKAYNLKTKQILWELEVKGSSGSLGCTPAISDTLLFVGGQKGDGLVAANLKTGKQKWLNPIGSLYESNPVLDNNGHVFIVKDSLYCIDINTGKTVWTFSAGGQISPSIKNDTLFITAGMQLYALECGNGNVIWKSNIPNGYVSQLPVDNKTIYYCSYSSVCAFDIKTGIKRWDYSLGENYRPVQFFSSGNLCITDSVLCITIQNGVQQDDNKLLSLNKFTGKKLWEHSSRKFLFSPKAANGVIYTVPFQKSEIIGFNHTTGDTVFIDKSRSYHGQFIIANHKLYVSCWGKIAVFRNKTTSITDKSTPLTNIEIYPNPTSNFVTIHFNKTFSKVSYSIFDLTGRMLDKKDIETTEIKIDMSEYYNGSYILKLNDGQQPLQTFKIIKR